MSDQTVWSNKVGEKVSQVLEVSGMKPEWGGKTVEQALEQGRKDSNLDNAEWKEVERQVKAAQK